MSTDISFNHSNVSSNEKYHRLHILVNNAGIAFGGSITELSIEEWRLYRAIGELI